MTSSLSSSLPAQSISLSETFHHKTTHFNYAIKWTSLGSPTSQPLIFIHGTPWSSIVWHPFALSLSKYFQVYLFDNPGFGSSPLGVPIPDESSSMTKDLALDADLSQQSEVFAALYHHWEESWAPETKAHVIAHDHGGLMALRAHLLHKCQFQSLCLIDVVAVGPFGLPLFDLVARNEEVFLSLPDSVFEGIVESYIHDAAHTRLSDDTMAQLKEPWLKGRGQGGNEEGKKGFIRQMLQANSRNADAVEGMYADVGKSGDMPVRIIWGKEDKWIPVETAEKLRRKLGLKEEEDVVVIEGAGHLVMYDQPARLGVEIGLWLAGLK